MKNKIISTFIIIIGIIFVSISLIMLFSNNSEKKDNKIIPVKLISSNLKGDNFDFDTETIDDFDTNKLFVNSFNIKEKKIINFYSIFEPNFSTRESTLINEEKNELTVFTFNDEYKLNIKDYLNDEKDFYKDLKYDKYFEKKLYSKIDDYDVHFYYSIFYNNSDNQLISKLYIFLNNKYDNCIISYALDNKMFSDDLINKLISNISIEKDNNVEITIDDDSVDDDLDDM
jgi:hypothetical protein